MPVKWSFKILLGGDGSVLHLELNSFPQNEKKYRVMELNFEHFELDDCKFANFKAKQHSVLKDSKLKIKKCQQKRSDKKIPALNPITFKGIYFTQTTSNHNLVNSK